MAELSQIGVNIVSHCLKSICREGELTRETTIRQHRIVDNVMLGCENAAKCCCTSAVECLFGGKIRGRLPMNPNVVITLNAEALMHLQEVLIDEDPAAALDFIKTRILPQVPKKGTAPCDSTRINPYLWKDQSDT
jgi:hypothetical protein